MSYVTTVTIISDDYDDQKNIDKLNEYLKENRHLGGKFEKIPNGDKSAGTKYPERQLYWGGLNYLHHDEFIELFRSLHWGNSILILGHDDSESGYIVVPSKDDYGDCKVEVMTKYK